MACFVNTKNSLRFSELLKGIFKKESARKAMASMVLSSYCNEFNIMDEDGINKISPRALGEYWNRCMRDSVRLKFIDSASPLEAVDLEKELYKFQDNVDRSRTTPTSYYIKEEDGEYHKYDRLHSIMGDTWTGPRSEETKKKAEIGVRNGNIVHDFIAGYLSGNKTDDSGLTANAKDELIKGINDFLNDLKEQGRTIIGTNIALYGKNTEGRRIAGEADLVVKDKDNNIYIYDFKSSKNPYSGEGSWFDSHRYNTRSTKEQYSLQLSAYRELLSAQFGTPVSPKLVLVPFIVRSRGDKVSEVTPVDNIELEVSPELKDVVGSIESHLVNTEEVLKSNDSETKEWGVKGENSSSIYDKLGDKTESKNVKLVEWKSLKDTPSSIVDSEKYGKSIVATRTKNSINSFGNPFTHDSRIADRNGSLIKVATTEEAVKDYIDWLTTDKFDNVEPRRKEWILNKLKSGELRGLPILYYKELNQPSHATALDYLINEYDWDTPKASNIKDTSSSSVTPVVKGENSSSSDTTKQVKGKGYIVNKIISGGQTGVDTIGLEVGNKLGIETGGTATPSFTTEKGKDSIDKKYGLKEISSELQNGEKGNRFYLPRTRENVKNSDGTVYFSVHPDDNKGGIRPTRKYAESLDKPFLLNPTAEELATWIKSNNIHTLNVAGNRGSHLTEEQYKEFSDTLESAFKLLDTDTSSSSVTEKELKEPAPVGNVEDVNKDIKEESELLKQCNIDIPAAVRENRVLMIAQYFTTGLEIKTNEVIETLKEEIKKEKDPFMVNYYQSLLNDAEKNPHSLIKGRKNSTGIISLGDCFNEGRQILLNYMELSRDEMIAHEKDFYECSDEKAEELVDRKIREYPKIIKYYKILAREASGIIESRTGLRVDISLNYTGSEQEDNSEKVSPVNNDQEDESDANDSKIKDWAIQWDEVDPRKTVSEKVRSLLNTIPQIDYEGYRLTDDLGMSLFIDPGMAHTLLLERLRGVNSIEDMMNILENMAKARPWVQEIIDRMEGSDEYEKDPQLKSLFYLDLCKEYTPAFIIKSNPDYAGVVETELIPINNEVNSSTILDEAKDNINNSVVKSSQSVYDKSGKVSMDKMDNLSKLIDNINIKIDKDGDYLNSDTMAMDVHEVLAAIGFDVIPDRLKELFIENKKAYDSISSNVMGISSHMGAYTADIKKNKDTPLYSTFGSYYKNIAQVLSSTIDKEVPASYREMGKMKYSYTPKSYLGTMMNRLTNSMGYDEAEYMRWINERFLKFGWFNKNGVILNSWLDSLINGTPEEEKKKNAFDGYSAEEMRSNLKFCTINNNSKISYEKWSDLDTFNTLYTMYIGASKGRKDKTADDFAYYALPTLSDSFTTQFIRFKRYSAARDYGLGNYKDMVINDLYKVVIQELNRITLVNERADMNISPIDNYDKKASKDGIGGAKFFFIKELNDVDNGGFYDKCMELSEKEDKLELRKYIVNKLTDVYEGKFGEFMKELSDNGVLATTKDGYYKYFPNVGKKLSDTNKKKIITRNLEEFFYNYSLAQSQIIELLTTDLAFYKNNNDFIKRWKEVYSSMLRMNTEAEYKNSDGVITKVGRRYEKCLYIDDLIERTDAIKDITKVLDEKIKKGQINEGDKQNIIEAFNEVNVSDGQAFRTLDSYRTVRIMSGNNWDDNMEDTFNRFKRGDWTMRDFKFAWQTIKSFTYSVTDVKGDNGGERIPVPTQHKDSEAMLLYQMIAHLPGQKKMVNPILEGLSDFMSMNYNDGLNHGVDVAVFKSGVKVGCQGSIDIFHRPLTEDEIKRYGVGDANALNRKLTDMIIRNSTISDDNKKDRIDGQIVTEKLYNDIMDSVKFKTAAEVTEYLKKVTGVGENNGFYKEEEYTPEFIHSVDYNDYGIQMETPEHMFDAQQMIGSQISKLIFSDTDDDVTLTVGGRDMTKKEFLKLYNSMSVAGRVQGLYKLVRDIYPDGNTEDKSGLSKLILESMSGDNKYSYDMLRAAMVDRNGQFILPPYESLHTVQIQNICFSLLRSRVIKQKTAGGSAIQMTCAGNENLHIKFSNDPHTGKRRVEYVECFMPFYIKDKIQGLLNSKGIIDMNRIDPKLLEVIGYRIPTEDKYSMLPLKIVGFLPQEGGTTIIMPKEVTVLTGSDFDVDKMYLIFPEYDRSEGGENGYTYEHYVNEVVNDNRDSIVEKVKTDLKSDERYAYEDSMFEDAYETVYNRTKGEHLDDRTFMKEVDLEYRQIVYSQEGEDAPTYIARKKEFVKELRTKTLQYMKGLREDLLNPKSKNYKEYHSEYLENIKEGKIQKNRLNKLKYDLPIDEKGSLSTDKVLGMSQEERNNLIHDLMWASLTSSSTAEKLLYPQSFDNIKDAASRLKKLTGNERTKLSEDILSPMAYVYYHSQNTVGKQMIAIYASSLVTYALSQNTKLEIDPTYGFNFGSHNKPTLSLHETYDSEGRLISKNIASFLGAAADTAKDPILAYLYQSEDTASISCLLLSLGYSPYELGLLLAQPVVQKVLKEKQASPFEKLSDLIGSELRGIIRDNKFTADVIDKTYNTFLSISDLENNFITDDAKQRMAVLQLLSKINDIADNYRTLTSAMKFDTTKGSIGATEGDLINGGIKIDKAKKLFEDKQIAEDTFIPAVFTNEYDGIDVPFINGFELKDMTGDNSKIPDIKDTFKWLLDSELPIVESSYTCTYGAAYYLFKDMFTSDIPIFRNIVTAMSDMSRNGQLSPETVNKLRPAFQQYMITGADTFGEEGDITAKDKRDWYINRFPEKFLKFIESNKYPGEFINQLTVGVDKSTGANAIQFKGAGNLSYKRRDNMMRDWTMMVESNDPEISDMGKRLFVYGLFKYGLRFSPSGYMHLASIDVLNSIPGYLDIIKKLIKYKSTIDISVAGSFIESYIRNNPFCELSGIVSQSDIESISDDNGDEYFKVINGNSRSYMTVTNGSDYKLYKKVLIYVGGSKVPVYKELPILHNEYEFGNSPETVYKSKQQYSINRNAEESSKAPDYMEDEDYLNSLNEEQATQYAESDSFWEGIREMALRDSKSELPADEAPKELDDATFDDSEVIGVYSIGDNSKLEVNKKLNKSLRLLMKSYGVSEGSLTALEEELGQNGVTQFGMAKTMGEGIVEVIRLAKGIRGEKALPEEFAHWAYRVLLDKGDKLAERMLNHLINNNLAKDVLGDNYDRYYKLYNGDEYRLAEEAAGHLIADGFNRQTRHKSIINKISSLFKRVIDSIKRFFGHMDEKPVLSAMDYANEGYGKIAQGILKNSYDLSSGVSKEHHYTLYNVAGKIKTLSDIAKNMLDRELKYLHIQKGKKAYTREGQAEHKELVEKESELVSKLSKKIKRGKVKEGILSTLKQLLSDLNDINSQVRAMGDGPQSLTVRGIQLRGIKNRLYSYSKTVLELREFVNLSAEDEDFSAELKPVLDEMTTLYADVDTLWNEQALNLFAAYLQPYLGKKVQITVGKNKGRVYDDASQLLREVDGDISQLDLWLESMSNSSDYMLKAVDQAVKDSKENKRLRVIEYSKQIKALGVKLRESGINDFDFMYEKSEGKLTGNYITEEDSKRLDTPRKQFYDSFMSIYRELKELLPSKYSDSDENQAVQIRKDLMERMVSSGSLKSGVEQLFANASSKLVRNVDDDMFGVKYGIQDFEGKEYNMVPVFYMNKLKNMDRDLSLDAVSTLIALADTAVNFDEMSKICDILEVGKEVIRKRKVNAMEGDKTKMGTFTEMAKKVTSKMVSESDNILSKYQSFLESQVYGKFIKDNGEVSIPGTENKTFNVTKSVDMINRMNSTFTLAGNMLSGLSSMFSDITMLNSEAVAGQFFNMRELFKADKIYGSELVTSIGDIGSRVKTGKLNLFIELFDLMRDEQAKHEDFDKGRIRRFISMDTLYFFQHAGDHWGNCRSAVAMALHTKLKDKYGRDTNLWDALDIEYLDNNDHSKGARLKVKEGTKNADGSEFDSKSIIAFSNKCRGLSNYLFGVYNKYDSSVAQRYMIGRLAMSFRKYLIPAYERRFMKANFNMDLDTEMEGYYRTAGRVISNIVRDLRKGQLTVLSTFNSMTDLEKQNMARAATEAGTLMLLTIAVMLLDKGIGKDLKKRPWLVRSIAYFTNRLRYDVSVLTPSRGMIEDNIQLIKNPFPIVNTLGSMIKVLDMFYPTSWIGKDSEVKQGFMKGYKVGLRDIIDSPFFPMRAQTFYKIGRPERFMNQYR